MKIKLINNSIENYDGLIIPFFEDKVAAILDLPVDQLAEKKKFESKFASVYKLTKEINGNHVEIVLLGLGKEEEITNRRVQKAIATAYKVIKKAKTENVGLVFDQGNVKANEFIVKASVEGLLLGDYSFDTYKSEKTESEVKVCDIVVENPDLYNDVYVEAKTLGKATREARQLINEPANVINPVTLAKKVKNYGEKYGFEVEVFGQKQIQKLGMKAYLAVAKGSSIKPKFIVMRYNGNPESEDRLGYVGKGLTYDAGGLSIKPTAGMVTMKDDMGGAAAVISSMTAIAKQGLKVNVTAVVAACENMISGSCYKPGDIIGSMGGKSIFIGNTDAEGRLTLIDAMHYIVTKEKVNKVVDIATLTGAALHCTGDVATVSISNDDEFFGDLNESFNMSGEHVWRMPIYEEYKELVKHEEADLTNTAGRPGTITAGLFIGEFNGDLPWIHLDIAGSVWMEKDSGIYSKGGTGAGTRPLYYLAKKYSK